MKEKLRQIERVRQLRETRERMSEASVALATTRLHEAEMSLAKLREAERGMARESIRAIERGERSEWTMSLTLRKALGQDSDRFEKERRKLEEAMMSAQRELKTRRIETEQAVALRRDVRVALQMEEEHRAQVESMDRFLARSRWSSARVCVRSLIEGD
jgi:hypothetical protein